MAAPRITISPFLNDFLYDVIYHASIEEKKNLPRRYIKKVKNTASARRFVDHSYLEEKMEVFSALGVQWYMVFFDDGRNKLRTIRQIFEAYKVDIDKSMAANLIEKKVYVTSDRHFAYNHGLMSDSTNNKQYTQNMLLSKGGYHIQKWKKEMRGTKTDVARNHVEISKYMAEMGGNMAAQLKFVDGFLGIKSNDWQILNYLYIKQDRYVDYADMVRKFSGDLNLNKITGCVRRLLQSGMASKTPKAKEKKYQITALGINAISTFYKNVLKANEF